MASNGIMTNLNGKFETLNRENSIRAAGQLGQGQVALAAMPVGNQPMRLGRMILRDQCFRGEETSGFRETQWISDEKTGRNCVIFIYFPNLETKIMQESCVFHEVSHVVSHGNHQHHLAVHPRLTTAVGHPVIQRF